MGGCVVDSHRRLISINSQKQLELLMIENADIDIDELPIIQINYSNNKTALVFTLLDEIKRKNSA